MKRKSSSSEESISLNLFSKTGFLFFTFFNFFFIYTLLIVNVVRLERREKCRDINFVNHFNLLSKRVNYDTEYN